MMFKKITLTCEQRKKIPRAFTGLFGDCRRGKLTLHIAKVECDPPQKRGPKPKKRAARN